MHALEDWHLRMALRYHHLDEVTMAARKAAQETLDRHGVKALVEVVQAIEASDGLAVEARRAGADAIVVGRHAGLEGSGLGKLGSIARGALRDLSAAPVIVVPHDLTSADVGSGPVLALTSLGKDSVEAVKFARRFADWTGRELVVAHAVRVAVDRGIAYLAFPPEALKGHREERVAEGREALEVWVGANDVSADRLHEIIEGSVLSGAPRLAMELGSPVLVTGSRRFSGLDHRLHASVGSELAASAPLAVVVVPPVEPGYAEEDEGHRARRAG